MTVSDNHAAPTIGSAPVDQAPINIQSIILGLTTAQPMTPDSSEKPGKNVIEPWMRKVYCLAVTNDANDFVVLPALAAVPIGHTIEIIGPTATAMEVRTPASSNEEINSEDGDGTKEYLMGSANTIHIFRKINDTIGWMGQGFTAIGAVVTAVVPD